MPVHGLTGWGVAAIFVLVYAGMILGVLPRLKLDRSGVEVVWRGCAGAKDLAIKRNPASCGSISSISGACALSFFVAAAAPHPCHPPTP